MEMIAALFVGSVLGIAIGLVGLSVAGLAYMRTTEWIGRPDAGRQGCRRDAGCTGCAGKVARSAEPARGDALRVFRGAQ